MRAQCCICADLFENQAYINIAAVPCGHTFHEECLMRWLSNSSTCPSCRKTVKKNQIIKRLFFDIGDIVEHDEPSDSNQLLNKINDLKAELSSVKTVKNELQQAKDALAVANASKELLSEKLSKGERETILLRQRLVIIGEENSRYAEELAEFKAIKKKLKQLQEVQKVLEGSELDVSEVVECHSGGGEPAIKQLSSMLVVLKREYSKLIEEKKALREEMRTLNIELIQARTKIKSFKKEKDQLEDGINKSSSYILDLEEQNDANRRKIVHLRNALKRNKTEGSQSFIEAINEDSPNVAYTPPSSTLQSDKGGKKSDSVSSQCHSQDLFEASSQCHSPDLYEDSMTSESEKSSLKSQLPVASSVLKMVHIPTAADKFKAKKKADEDCAPNFPLSYHKYSIMQKVLTGVSSSRTHVLPQSRTYDGFGGSMRLDSDFGTPNRVFSRPQGLKRKASNKRCPLAPKVIPNQPKFKDCLTKLSSLPTAKKDQHTEVKPPPVKQQCIGDIFVMTDKSKSSDKSSKSTDKSKSTSTASSRSNISSSSSHLFSLSRPNNGFVDLT